MDNIVFTNTNTNTNTDTNIDTTDDDSSNTRDSENDSITDKSDTTNNANTITSATTSTTTLTEPNTNVQHQSIMFFDLFTEAAQASGFEYNKLHKDVSYFFELCHPLNTVVIVHPKPRLVHLGSRSNTSLCELPNVDIGVEQPMVFSISSITACIEAASMLEGSTEGFVAMSVSTSQTGERKINRVKIKSPKYVAMHHLKTKSIPKVVACATVLLTNEVEEIEVYRADASLADFADDIHRLQRQLEYVSNTLAGMLEPLFTNAPLDDVNPKAHIKYFAIATKQLVATLDAPKIVSKSLFALIMELVRDHIGTALPNKTDVKNNLTPHLLDTDIKPHTTTKTHTSTHATTNATTTATAHVNHTTTIPQATPHTTTHAAIVTTLANTTITSISPSAITVEKTIRAKFVNTNAEKVVRVRAQDFVVFVSSSVWNT